MLLDNITLTQSAFADLSRYQQHWPALMPSVIEHLRYLAINPDKLSRPSYLPFPPGYRIYIFSKVFNNSIHQFIVLFKQDEKENKIIIYNIGHVESH